MKRSSHDLVREFFSAIAAGNVPEELTTPDMTFWSINSGTSDKERFLGGIKVLASIFGGTLTYQVDALTTEEDRIVAEVRSRGTLVNGEPFSNDHVFLFRVRDGRLESVREFMNQSTVREKIIPLMQAALNRK